MKLAFTILCGLLLAITPAMGLQSSRLCAAMKGRGQFDCQCHCCGKMPCCAQRCVSHSGPAPLAVNAAGAFNQSLIPAHSVLGWQPPTGEISLPSFGFSSVQITHGAPLYQRNCALLI